VNAFRSAQNPPRRPISWSAIKNFTLRSTVISRKKRGFKKSGKDDPSTPWAQARLQQMLQFKEMLRLGRLPTDSPEIEASPFPPLILHALVFWDEKHAKVQLNEKHC
jgi:hypothetical protein